MPAGASASTSAARQRKIRALEAQLAGGRGSGRGMSRDQTVSSARMLMGGSQRNLMGGAGSSRNLMSGSQRNLMRPPQPIPGGGVLGESMPTLMEANDSFKGNFLEDSTRSNPELFLTHLLNSATKLGKDAADDDDGSTSNSIELRHRAQPQDSEHKDTGDGGQGRGNGTPRQGRDTGLNTTAEATPQKLSPRIKSKSSDSFNDNVARGPPPSSDSQLPRFLRPCNHLRKFTGAIVNDNRVQNTVLLMIVVNAIMMGVATFPSIKNNPEMMKKFDTCDLVFLIIFTIESAMQLIYHGWMLFKDGFLVFDLLIVVMSWALDGTQVFRAFRIFRAMRLITRVGTLKNLVLALFSVVPKMTAIFMLLTLIFYIFAVMFTQLYKGMHRDELIEEPYFETLYWSLFTLFQMMTLDEWAEILFQVQETYKWAWLPFVTFIIITGFVVVNLIIAVICDAVHVMGTDVKGGLHGYESSVDEQSAGGTKPNETNAPADESTSTELRLQELQRQLDEMVTVQEQMRTTIHVLITQIRENAAKEESLSCLGELNVDLLGGQISRSRTSPPIPLDMGLGSRTM